MRKLKSKYALALAAVVLAGAGGGGAAIAASGDGSPSPSAFFESLAQHLGISTDKLKDATKAAALDQVDAALKAGTITQAQADELKSRIESSDYPFFGFGFVGGFHGPHGVGMSLSAAADYLDLTVAQLQDKLRSGQSLADVANAQGKSVDGLKQAILDDAKTRLDEAVSDGTLTADQESAILDRLQSRIDDFVNNTHPRIGLRLHFFAGPPPVGA